MAMTAYPKAPTILSSQMILCDLTIQALNKTKEASSNKCQSNPILIPSQTFAPPC